jgi:hypothetical protein
MQSCCGVIAVWTEPLLDAVAGVTAGIIAVAVGYMLKRKAFNREPRSNLAAFVLVCLAISVVMSFLLFHALVYEEAYGMGRGDGGRRYPLSRDPVTYWLLVVLCYCSAVTALSFGLAAAVGLAQGGGAPVRAAQIHHETGADTHKRLERLWAYASAVYLMVLVLVLFLVWKGGWQRDLPSGLPFAGFSLAFLSFGLLALYTGETRGYRRRERPLAYWLSVGLMLLIGVGLLLLGIDLFLG